MNSIVVRGEFCDRAKGCGDWRAHRVLGTELWGGNSELYESKEQTRAIRGNKYGSVGDKE